MCPLSPLESFAQQICVASKIISAYCQSSGYPHPSFDTEAPSITIPSSAPQYILSARQTLVEAALKIQQLATEPSDYLPRLTIQYQHLSCLRWLCHFRILSFVPLHGSAPYADVAVAAGVPESHLKRVARMAMTSNFLCEPVAGELAHNANSALLVTNPKFLDWALFMTESSAPTASKMVEATDRWGETSAKEQTAYNIAMKTELSFFDHLSCSSHLERQFAAYMKNATSSEGTSMKHLVNGFDWASLREATIVDVGGSSGHASIALASSFPQLNCIVQDRADTLASCKTNLASLPDSVSSRISFQPHDFFGPQPVKGADVYLLRMILHEWPTGDAAKILANLALALKPGARILVMDTVLHSPGSIPTHEEALLRARDLTMLQVFNSQERDLGDWTRLLAQTECNLSLKSVRHPFGSLMSVMEVVQGPTRLTEEAKSFHPFVAETPMPIAIL
ncbi:S-adenosyl-L-methionine-dependent methyltransferase [Xylona heveae TC161]|uniref:S-adenosyl-L-methionine-dependent methyltransferase n=1 Tax=Xylona heveae (strain CBS 132557 / TC161) TaxID=1328760 RepID=A0A165JKN7_XYLHT|nr:S-adenosyl-L-methionine-dependent methyltransferase [Xylona heveae TC161]KZF26356.1 S-adenosyl-L-methionine-dependent methyltransferase [Xylona heveae TC161]